MRATRVVENRRLRSPRSNASYHLGEPPESLATSSCRKPRPRRRLPVAMPQSVGLRRALHDRKKVRRTAPRAARSHAAGHGDGMLAAGFSAYRAIVGRSTGRGFDSQCIRSGLSGFGVSQRLDVLVCITRTGTYTILDNPPANWYACAQMARGSAPDAKHRIMEAALKAFNADGIPGVSADAIIEQAGVAKMTLYKYFPTKDALAAAFIHERSDR